jgi:hypothetical protein
VVVQGSCGGCSVCEENLEHWNVNRQVNKDLKVPKTYGGSGLFSCVTANRTTSDVVICRRALIECCL